MKALTEAIERRFDADDRLTKLGRRIYVLDDEKSDILPFVTMELTFRENISGFLEEIETWGIEFVARCRGPSRARIESLLVAIRRRFDFAVFDGDGITIVGMFRDDGTSGALIEGSRLTYEGSVSYNVFVHLTEIESEAVASMSDSIG